ncbi:hypothetical protein F4778DRAFT_641182 [Xylariomycetidae sp. FL2044]|nr:hypothetical protein F4778DRAFT_641182 [Xylariomycetidae sp. FL2044]
MDAQRSTSKVISIFFFFPSLSLSSSLPIPILFPSQRQCALLYHEFNSLNMEVFPSSPTWRKDAAANPVFRHLPLSFSAIYAVLESLHSSTHEGVRMSIQSMRYVHSMQVCMYMRMRTWAVGTVLYVL